MTTTATARRAHACTQARQVMRPGSTGTSVVHDYDDADRIYGGGYVYDDFGRITTVPSADANGGYVTSSYFVNDLVRSLSQDGITRTFDLDPQMRLRIDALTGGDGQTRTDHFADDSDSPAWTTQTTDGFRWTRNIEGIGGGLVASQDNQTGTTLRLTNLHGDVVASASLSQTATGLAATIEADEFGVPRQPRPPATDGSAGRNAQPSSRAASSRWASAPTCQASVASSKSTQSGRKRNDYEYADKTPSTPSTSMASASPV